MAGSRLLDPGSVMTGIDSTSRSERFAQRGMAGVCTFLERRLKLRIHTGKSRIVRSSELDYLGFCFAPGRIRNLRALGVPIRQAVGLGRSSLGPWKCARLLGFAMSKSWLEKPGPICLADDWWRCAPFG